MQVGKIAGIQIKLNGWFIAVILLFTVADMCSKVLLVFSAVLLHELAHAGVALFLGCKVREVELLPFGGVARIEGLGAVSSKTEMMIAAAGPAASLVLAVLAYLGMIYTDTWADIWEFYVKTNTMLALFNLLPGLPLDGGRILRAWLALYMDYGKATFFVASISNCLSLIFLGVLVYQYMTQSTVNVTFLMAAIFLYITAKSERKIASFRTLRILGQKKAQLIAKGIMTTTYFTVMNRVLLKDVIGLFKPDQYYILLVVDAECKLCGTLSETKIWEELPNKGLYTKVEDFIQ
ncbi:M50 family metallopeptidase [Pelosinus sp. sgz500959]|uniref:M50 family metallopeptidase n=1 Tax=Pelosinus sp. sgz500959 TaxID=3242472 RepID=UPI00366E19DC